jgi:hypothetical protein
VPCCSSRSALCFDTGESAHRWLRCERSEPRNHHSREGVGVSARRPGRTQKIAYDETPLNAANADIDARIGWLWRCPACTTSTKRSRTAGTSRRHSRTRGSRPVGACSRLAPQARSRLPRLRGTPRRAHRQHGDRAGAGPGLAGVRLAPGRGPNGAPAAPGLGGAQPPADRAAAPVDQGLLPAAEHGGDEHGGRPSGAGLHGRRDRGAHLRPRRQGDTTPAGLLDRLPTRQAARLVLEIIESRRTASPTRPASGWPPRR